MLGRQVKSRRESIEAYTAAGRTEAAAKEQAELEIVSSYLPAALGEDEVENLVKETIEEVGVIAARHGQGHGGVDAQDQGTRRRQDGQRRCRAATDTARPGHSWPLATALTGPTPRPS